MPSITPFPPLSDLSGGVVIQPVGTPTPTQIQPVGAPKRRLFLTTVRIPDDQIWANGLFQNIYILYKLFEALGYEPYLLVDSLENNKDAKIHETFRMLDFKTYIQAPFPVAAYMEFGMSCDPMIRKFFRNTGAKVAKTYLGNILNIDVETITFYRSANFSHHVAGELDEIWVSPHYDFHAYYAGSINGMCGRTRIAPYVWDPHFVKSLEGIYQEPAKGTARRFAIMEPNISFQKNSLISILAMEAYYRRHPERVKEIVVVNGARIKESPYFQKSILPNLRCFAEGKLQLMPRAHMHNFAQVYKDAVIIQHQVNNEYNYSFLEWLYMGFPVVHNHRRLGAYGYYYPENDFEAAADQIERVVDAHVGNQETYKAQARQLLWRFSIHNPDNMAAWQQLITQ
jgi:hypothetical protein